MHKELGPISPNSQRSRPTRRVRRREFQQQTVRRLRGQKLSILHTCATSWKHPYARGAWGHEDIPVAPTGSGDLPLNTAIHVRPEISWEPARIKGVRPRGFQGNGSCGRPVCVHLPPLPWLVRCRELASKRRISSTYLARATKHMNNNTAQRSTGRSVKVDPECK